MMTSSGFGMAVWDSTWNLGNGGSDPDIFYATTNDGGVTWSALKLLNAYGTVKKKLLLHYCFSVLLLLLLYDKVYLLLLYYVIFEYTLYIGANDTVKDQRPTISYKVNKGSGASGIVWAVAWETQGISTNVTVSFSNNNGTSWASPQLMPQYSGVA